jgi:hypothetical protein
MRTSLFIVMLLTSVAADAQTISPSVLAATGGASHTSLSQGSVSLSWTVGQEAVGSFTVPGHQLTVGFQQPVLELISSVEVNAPYAFTVFPNPMHDHLQVVVSHSAEDLVLQLHDVFGRVIDTRMARAGTSILSYAMTAHAPGSYYLVVLTTAGVRRELHKLLKTR